MWPEETFILDGDGSEVEDHDVLRVEDARVDERALGHASLPTFLDDED